MSDPDQDGILTLEPLIDAVRAGVEECGWRLSGVQKTTSHSFEGRWEGESTRSAYLFFHSPSEDHDVSIDVYLDETSRGLTGNVALVVDLAPLDRLGPAVDALERLCAISEAHLPRDGRRPITLRLRVDDASSAPGGADTEVRFKVRLRRAEIARGDAAVRQLTTKAVDAFRAILASPELRALVDPS